MNVWIVLKLDKIMFADLLINFNHKHFSVFLPVASVAIGQKWVLIYMSPAKELLLSLYKYLRYFI